MQYIKIYGDFDFKRNDDPHDLFDLKATFREAINFPNNFNRLAHKAYQRIMEADQESLEKIKEEVEYLVKRDSLLMEDEIIRDFLKEPDQDFYREVKRKTAFALQNYNFDLETWMGLFVIFIKFWTNLVRYQS